MAEVDLLGVLVIFEHREIDDPAEFEPLGIDQTKLFADPRAGKTRKFRGLTLLTGSEEHAIIRAKTERLGKLRHTFVTMILGDRSTELAAPCALRSQALQTFGLRPAVHIVEELPALLRSVRRGNGPYDVTTLDDRGEAAEARSREMLRDIADQDRIAQIGLVIAVFQH